MKLLWLCNTAPGVVRSQISGSPVGAVNWVDHVLDGMQKQQMTIRILCPGDGSQGDLQRTCSYATFQRGLPYEYQDQVEAQFRQELIAYAPDVIHIWGTEYAHTLAMVKAARKENRIDRVVISIQGLCTFIAAHYCEGLPYSVQRRFTLRDFLRQDAIFQQQRKFAKRGLLEAQALAGVSHVIGRTHWDKACTALLHPGVTYHFCNETLRKPFYEGRWQYETCCRHRIFASSCEYPVKGFHYLLKALALVRRQYPDATVTVPGRSFLTEGISGKLHRNGYEAYLAEITRKNHMESAITFLGDLSAEEMKASFLEANVFALPSTVENSPNSLGEAMLLGVPCVAADVGGVSDLMTQFREGYLYQPTAPYMLAQDIKTVFAMEQKAEALGTAAQAHAAKTHDPQNNLQTLTEIYQSILR